MGMALKADGRLRRDMSGVLTRQPMIASTALFMKHVDQARGGPTEVAATDGRNVYIWPAFHAYGQAARYAILLHEYLHAILQHPLRGMKLKRRYGPSFRADILNIGADAIINEGILNGTGRDKSFILPDDCVKLKTIARQAKSIVELTGVKVDHERMAKVGKLSIEWMYDALIRLEEAAKKHCACKASGDGGQSDAEDSTGESGSGGQESEPQAGNDNASDGAPADAKPDPREKDLREFIENTRSHNDMKLDHLEKMNASEIDDAISEGVDRLKAAMAMNAGHGNGRGNIIEELQGDIPVVATPWEASFRSITQRHLSRQRLRRPTKPGRRVLTQEAMQTAHIVWSPGRTRPPVPRVVVILDTSGSIRADEYLRYLGEIQAMKRRTNAQVFVIVADASVQAVYEIDDAKKLAEVKFEGRGGTDFRPGVALAVEMQADLIVYLTDLMGTFPDEDPGIPILWTLSIPEVPSGYEPPFGRVLHLN